MGEIGGDGEMNHDLIAQFISLSSPVPLSPLYWISFFAPLRPLCLCVRSRSLLRSRVVLVVDPFEPLPAHVGVDLSRSDVRVSQHELEASQIRSALEKMGGEGVAHHVGGERSLDSREASVFLQKLEESLSRHWPPAPAQEQTSLARLRGEERPARDQVTDRK